MPKNNLPFSYIEISKGKLVANINQFRKIVNHRTKIAAVVKSNAYGHGDLEVIKILAPHTDYFQINSLEELKRLRSVTKKPTLLFGYISKNELAKAISLGCILSVFDLKHALLINECALKIGKKQKVHIAIDAHLGREGVMPNNLETFLKGIQKMKYLVIDGVYAHFANLEDTNDFSHAQKQVDTYTQVLSVFKIYELKNIHTHISATSGVLAYEKCKGLNSIVRIGIGLYGMFPSKEFKKEWQKKIILKPVLRFVTHIAQVKNLPAHHTIGYGLSYITNKPTTIAVIPMGYSDGIVRNLSNKGEVLIGGKHAPILGRVSMNMLVVNISHIKNIIQGEQVIILGTQKNEKITAEEIAEKSGTINYEVTTRISPFLPKIIVK
jgi:alanine racemase